MRVIVLLLGLTGCDRLFNIEHVSSKRDGGPGTGDSLASDADDDGDAALDSLEPPSNLVTGMAAGGTHSCAFMASGALRCWGAGTDGRLGGSNTLTIGDDEAPRSVPAVGVGGTVVRITAGDAHTCALLNNGAIRCWGLGLSGRLGYGNSTSIGDNEAPSTSGDVNVGGAATQVEAGGSHTCARTGGSVVCWGTATNGRLGYGNTNFVGDNESPASAGVVAVGTTVLQVAAGGAHTCVVTGTSAVRCWGAGANGRLGYANVNDIGDNELPSIASDVGVGSMVTQVATGGAHTCALLSTGGVRCWGYGLNGALGYGNLLDIGDGEPPADAGDVSLGGLAIQITAGGNHTCALLANNSVRCWGANGYGQLGYGNTDLIGDNETPASAGPVSLGGNAVEVSAGLDHTCALMESGAVRCWGRGFDGRLGYGNTNSIGDNESPSSVGDVPVF